MAQDSALSRRQHGFESRWGCHTERPSQNSFGEAVNHDQRVPASPAQHLDRNSIGRHDRLDEGVDDGIGGGLGVDGRSEPVEQQPIDGVVEERDLAAAAR